MNENSSDWHIKPKLPDFKFPWESTQSFSIKESIEDFFHSPSIFEVKKRICDIGQRMWQRNFVDGNGGNISVRVAENLILCTPTLISKGFMTVGDICLVDINGKQKAGHRPSTSEILTHIAIYKNNPKASACVHAHPVHATTFSISGLQPPVALLPEVEIFLGEIALAPYRHPGSLEVGDLVGALAQNHQAILMQNHGAITWGDHVEDAYWKMENLDSYCQIILLAMASHLNLNTFTESELRRLFVQRNALNMPESRMEKSKREIYCINDDIRCIKNSD